MRSLIILIFLFAWANSYSATETDRQEQAVYNFYGSGSGFENGVQNVVVSSSTKNWEGTTKHTGNKALKCTFDATNDYCELKLVANPGATSNLEYGFFYYTTASTVKVDVIDGSANVVRTINPLPSNTAYSESILDFIGVASTSYKLRFTATSGAATIYIDTVHMSKNMNIGTVNLADKQYDLTVTGSNFTSQRATGIPYKTRDGIWRMQLNIKGEASALTSTTLTVSGVVFKSGVNNYQPIPAATTGAPATVVGAAYCNPGASTIELQTSISTSQYISIVGNVELDSMPTFATDYVSQQVTRVESTNGFGSVSWRNVSGCMFVAASGTMTDSDCNTGVVLPLNSITSGNDNFELTKTNLKANTVYKVSAAGSLYATGGSCKFSIYDGTNLIANAYASSASVDSIGSLFGYVSYPTAQASKTFSVQSIASGGTCHCDADVSGLGCMISIEEVYPQSAMPQIINSVATTYVGQSVLNSVRIGGASDNTECTGTCTLYGETGDWVLNITRGSTGDYTLNINAGIFTGTPTCTATSRGSATYDMVDISYVSSTQLRMFVRANAAGASDGFISLICHGIK